jgi:hypothetical protein
MIIADRLRELREAKKFSQGDIEKRTGLLRCCISRVENGHTVAALETCRSWREPSKCLCTSFSTMVKNRRSCRFFFEPGLRMTRFGGVRGNRQRTSLN